MLQDTECLIIPTNPFVFQSLFIFTMLVIGYYSLILNS